MLLMENERETQSKFFPHQSQLKIINCFSRFKLVFAGRRFGKSVLAVNECIDRALNKPAQKIWYCSPLYKQTKEIAWNLFDHYTPKEFIAKKNEAELKITFINGSEISLKGTDNPDSLVGVGLNFCVLDEFPLMDGNVWYKIVRPMMIDTKGECLFIGTPRGYNWAHQLYTRTRNDSDFASFFFKTVDNTAIDGMEGEVGKAKDEATSELDKIVFRQEYEATFEVITGRPRFDIGLLSKLRDKQREPIETVGLLDIFAHYDPSAVYVVGVDTSEGLETGDASTAIFLNCKTYQVDAEYNGKLAPDLLAVNLRVWGKLYGNPLMVVEDNNHGLLTLNELKQNYDNLYSRKTFDERANMWTEKLGFRTTNRTKPLLIGNLDKALRSGLNPVSPRILDELTTYIIEENGNTNASEGKHDDRVIGLGLAVQGYLESGHENIIEVKKKSIYTVPVDNDMNAYKEQYG